MRVAVSLFSTRLTVPRMLSIRPLPVSSLAVNAVPVREWSATPTRTWLSTANSWTIWDLSAWVWLGVSTPLAPGTPFLSAAGARATASL